MDSTRDGLTKLHLSTSRLSERDKVEAFRETFGRAILHVDMEPLRGEALSAEMTLQAFPGFALAAGSLSPVRSRHLCERTDNDDPVLVMVRSGFSSLAQNGRTIELAAGAIALTVNGERATFTAHTPTCVTNLRLSRRLLALHVANVDQALLAPQLRDGPALQLLRHYADLVNEAQPLDSLQLRESIAAHIHELAALAIVGPREAEELAGRSSVRAARLSAIKRDIAAEIGNERLKIDLIAARHGVTPRYVRMLFESEQTSFSEFVLEKRLSRARLVLMSPRHAGRAISAIAFDCGFGDLSYFNRTFRRRFGMTPSDLRATALRAQ